MTIQRMEHVGIVVDDLAAATGFFVELGLELQDEWGTEGGWVDRIVGLEDVRADAAMLETPDVHGHLELVKFHSRRSGAATATRRQTPWGSATSRAESTASRLSSLACEAMARSSLARWSSTRPLSALLHPRLARGSSSSWPSGSAEV